MKLSQTQLKRTLRLTWAVMVAVGLAACSSSKTNTTEETPEEAPIADAGTDAVPSTDVEDPNAAPPLADAAADPMAGVDSGTEPAPLEAGATAAVETPPVTDPAPMDPAAQPTPMEGSGAFESYSFKPGDTLMQIAFETYGDLYQWRKILEANKDVITDPSRIPAGTQLKLERPASPISISRNGEAYLIRGGDTLGTISQQVYGTPSKWRDLWENNREMIKNPNKIYAGFTLYYAPSGEANPLAKAPTTESAPAAETTTPASPGATEPSRQPASADQQPAPAAGVTQ